MFGINVTSVVFSSINTTNKMIGHCPVVTGKEASFIGVP